MAEIEEDEREVAALQRGNSAPSEARAQGEAFAATEKRVGGSEDGKGGESTTPPSTPPTTTTPLPGQAARERERNPNAEALRDVARFQLADDFPPGYHPKLRGNFAGRWYYTKPRWV
jgi:RNA polymerase II subunit A-like phosphatase